jgi:magnesium transporter
MSEKHFYHLSESGQLSHVPSLDAALTQAKKEGFLWVDYSEPTKEDLSALVEPLGLHPLAVEDCLDESQIPKIEDFPGNTFILINAFDYSSRQLTISEIDLFIGKGFLVSVSRPEQNRLWSNMEHIIQMDLEGVRHGPAFLMHVILDHVVDQKFVALEALEDELDTAEEAVLADTANFRPAELIRLRRDLLDLRKALFHEREILVKICRKDCPFIPDGAIFHYRDIYDHLAKFFELTESFRDIVTSLMEMYLSMLNNQMTRAANDTNVTVRRLTFITTIFMPLTLLAGIGGMSEWSMMTGPQNWRIAYPVFLLAMVVIGFVNYYLLKWLEKRRP